MTRKAFLLLLSLSTMLVPFTGAFRQVLVHRQEVVTPLRPTISNKIVYLHKHKPTSLWYQADNNENVTNFEAQEEARQRSERINGTGATGKSLLLIVFVFCAWMFTIPPEMRRMNLCDAAETAQNPESCITPGKIRQ